MGEKKRKRERSLEEERLLDQLGGEMERRKKIDKPYHRGRDWNRRLYGGLCIGVGVLFLLGGAGVAAVAANYLVAGLVLLPGLVFTAAGALYAWGMFDE
jgi:hypothetical protein